MNNELLYTLDPYIIAILFQAKDDNEALSRYNMILEDVIDVTNATTKEYLLENKFLKTEVDEVLALDDFDKAHPKFKPYLQNIILIDKLNSNIRMLLKTYYDVLLKNLPAEKQIELDTYLKENQSLLEERQTIIKNGLGIIKTILEDNGVESIAELEKKIGPINFEESIATKGPVEQTTINSPAINLGGVNTMNPTTPQSAPQPMPQAESSENLNPMNIPPTVDIPQGSAVDMALQSVINSPQPEVVNQELPVIATVEETPSEMPPEAAVTETPAVMSLEAPTELPVEMPVAETVPEMPAQEVAPTVTPEAMMGNEIQFTPLTEVPQVQEVAPQVTQEAQVTQEVVQAPPAPVIEAPISILDNQLPALPTNMSEQPVEMAQPQADVNQPLAAINKLDGLGISLDESANKPQ
jgi:hypothetical protein